MNTNAKITLDIPSDWNEFLDTAYYKAEYVQMSGDPHANMEELFTRSSPQFESCPDDGIKLMLEMYWLEPFNRDGLIQVWRDPNIGSTNLAPPPTTEAKIMALWEALNAQRRPLEFHQVFNGALAHYLAVEKLRQQAAYKLNCPGQRIWLREVSDVVGLMDLAMRKLDSAFDLYYRPFYHQYSVTIIPRPVTGRMNYKRFMKVTRELDETERKEAIKRKPAQHSEKGAK